MSDSANAEAYSGYLTVTQAAARLGVHRATIYRRISCGDLPTYRTARNNRVRLIDIADVEAIERVTKEQGRVRKDWTGKDWTDYLIEAAANRDGGRMADILDTDVYPETEPAAFPAADDARRKREEDANFSTRSDEWACL